ncbi:helix-turn-helix transcriptional regulator [Halomarina pelagica]|uniref:helix-turn-helix transcriptional regulator n=1 Tax=Halomarina pelagica TaxID=2961599 RepID=UPI0020C3A465|nr:hypothetical protein [Halomarina sp. BND7]
MRAWNLLRVATVVCLVGAIVPGTVALAERPGSEEATFGIAQPIEPDDVLLRVDVARNGTAYWVLEYRTRLDEPNVTEAFAGLREDVRAHPDRYSDRFARRMRDTVATAEAATGREMRLRNVTVSAESRPLPQRYGVMVYSFEWRGFAAREGERLLVGDALAGLFLDEQTQLVVGWPEGYVPARVDPPPDERGNATATWNGPAEFGAGGPTLALAPASGAPPLAPVALAAGAVVALAAGGLLYLARGRALRPLADPSGAPAGATASDATGGGPEAGTDAPATDAPATDPPVTDATPSDAAPDDGPNVPPELLSNEERVLRALERSGGRMRQQELVAELDWTEAKTSQVVGRLRDADEIESFRLGRENVLSLPDEVAGGERR